MISPLFTTIVLVGAFIWIYMKVTVKNVDKGTQNYIEREVAANNVRKQSLDSLQYITIDENAIPFISPAPSERIGSLYDTIRSLYSKKIVNLTGINNTDLKFAYGAANLPILTEYDQNYTTLTKTLFELGIELLSSNYTDEALKVLNYAVSIGTDISGVYISLANIYIENKQFDNIEQLIQSAQNIRSITKNTTISKLEEMLRTHETKSVAYPVNTSSDDSTMQLESVSLPSSSSLPTTNDDPDNILPKDILDILDFVNDISDDQRP